MIYLTMHSSNLLWLYGVGRKDHGDGQTGNPLTPLHGLLFSITCKEYFIRTVPQTGYHVPRLLV